MLNNKNGIILFFFIITIAKITIFSFLIHSLSETVEKNFIYRHLTLLLLYVLCFLVLSVYLKVNPKEVLKKNSISLNKSNFRTITFLAIIIGICSAFFILNLGSLSLANIENYNTLSNNYGKSIFTIISSCLLFPILEEILYRGFYCNFLFQSNESVKKSIWISAFLFYISHINFGTGQYFPSIFILFSGALYSTTSCAPSILAIIAIISILITF